jgi:hypothetical protein
MAKHVVICGLAPEVVDYDHYPGLTAERLMAALKTDADRLEALGYTVEFCLVSDVTAGDAQLANTLARGKCDCVLIGAGVREDPEHFLLFERLVNAAHQYAPDAKICFNTRPTDTTEAVRRWV